MHQTNCFQIITKCLYVISMQFFASNGFPCPTLRNPSDHYLRIINKDFDVVSIFFFLITIPTLEYNHHGHGVHKLFKTHVNPLLLNTRASYKPLIVQQALRKSLIFLSIHTSHLELSKKFSA